ncbi:MAG: hypothetical protein ACD_32C00112G0006 [uncultured bacterium]|uniref:DUF2304 domain-containing protein n=1 Tax=Candidatus Daviesbacteria bacterium GW2011_GWC2_40_12 TaxID=1618431 RepID=A0A0G0QQE3_9BACT|nr:MAG: hypothetical protein ACD_32C00112G0006 [uncultured bacterium]KKQ83428.1 MAG: hypothetical protein UT04_C0032G0007 [Candidatus Daviesbacteria bacterium GW2011_GWF2_38_7]KKR17235.1 MAG: hypothetical protein UT45_C0002G0064 [Candidatus Daviesbacteria bacterium GW2011_GWA2_39_33]KKR42634.1 MAG: hypothetical protein UT77_C0001G0085 [Candidatus Daviesbacteria bacterium GW2011_GWC2_40_12]OGE21310.1 MAG: hypothetical protein A2778_04035 [Candidatus Daviesbacteria bacterium RIFCSPHIGHO2_01_FULL_
MIIGLQLVAIVFALIMIYFAYLHYSRGELNGVEVLSWLIIWLSAIIIVVFPDLLRTFAQTFAISRLFDLMIVGGFIVVIPMIYISYVRTKRLEKKLEDYIRKETLKQTKK